MVQQETGGKQAYLDDPSKYHYGLDANGRRIAPHTGKVSTAFGPFGILESTAKRPGFGVEPLKDKSIDEQIRFASEYLAARSRSAGSIEGGLAGYGEGSGYSGSVMRRMRNQSVPAEGTPAGDLGAGAGARAGDGRMMAGGPLSGSMEVNLNLSPDAKRLLQPQPGPLSGAVKQATPFGASRSGGVTGQW